MVQEIQHGIMMTRNYLGLMRWRKRELEVISLKLLLRYDVNKNIFLNWMT